MMKLPPFVLLTRQVLKNGSTILPRNILTGAFTKAGLTKKKKSKTFSWSTSCIPFEIAYHQVSMWPCRKTPRKEKKAKYPPRKSTQDTKLVRDRVRTNFNSMMYLDTPEAFNLTHQLFLAENKEFEVFLAYFNSLWLPKKESYAYFNNKTVAKPNFVLFFCINIFI